MKSKTALIVIDMQNDFVTGALANKEAEAILKNVENKIKEYRNAGAEVFFTRDTHGENYMETQEGKMLPVPHCLRGSDGWQIVESLRHYARKEDIFDKETFGSLKLPQQLCGMCTDICVISNGLIFKAAFPETVIRVAADCCAGVTPESHEHALEAMKSCQIIVEK